VLLYLVQHGEAKKEEEDPERGLTDKGRKEVQAIAAYARKMSVQPDRIVHSPKLRAQQTAALLAGQLKPHKGMDQADHLLPMDDPGFWAEQMAGMQEDMMLIGHLPFMARMAGLLVCGDKEKMCVDFKMGGIVCLKRFDDNQWAVAWMAVPDMVRQGR
jgi:phosphohistidine phosphatase